MGGSTVRRSLIAAPAVALVSLGCGIAFGATQKGAQGARVAIGLQAIYTASGEPWLGVEFSPGGSQVRLRWSICRPPNLDACAAVATHAQSFRPGPTPTGTVFKASTTYNGKVYTARTATWLGTVHSTSPPQLTGRPRFGASITARPGRWSGGWQAEPGYRSTGGGLTGGHGRSFDDINIEACATRTAQRCVNLSRPGKFALFSNRPVTVGSAITGRYLFAVDQRYGPDTAFAGVGYRAPASVPVAHAGATVAQSAPLGPIAGPPRPTVTLIDRSRIRDGRLPIARVQSSARCRVVAIATGRRALRTVRLTIHGTGIVAVPWTSSDGNRLNVQLFVGDGPPVDAVTHVQGADA